MIAPFIIKDVLLAVIEHGKGLAETCVFFVGGSKVRLVDFLEKDIVVFDCEPIVTDNDVLYFKLLIDLLIPALVFLSELGDLYHISFNRRIELSFKDRKYIAWADKSITILIIQLESN